MHSKSTIGKRPLRFSVQQVHVQPPVSMTDTGCQRCQHCTLLRAQIAQLRSSPSADSDGQRQS